MIRKSISFTKPNDDWLKDKLEKAENSGFTNDSKEQILEESRSLLKNPPR